MNKTEHLVHYKGLLGKVLAVLLGRRISMCLTKLNLTSVTVFPKPVLGEPQTVHFSVPKHASLPEG